MQCHPERLDIPYRWTKARTVFVDSMSDLFHPLVPDAFIDEVFAVMATAGLKHKVVHRFLVLTKRAGRMRDYIASAHPRIEAIWARRHSEYVGAAPQHAMPWPLPNVGLGVTAEDQEMADLRIPDLLGTDAAMRFVSCEPLLGPVDLSRYLRLGALCECDSGRKKTERCTTTAVRCNAGTRRLNWVIAGGESGSKARPSHPGWFYALRDQAKAAGVPFFFKQWGEWAPRSECYHTLTNGLAASYMDPDVSRWSCIRLTNGGKDGHDLAAVDDGDDCYMQKVGRELAGELLDGVRHHARPMLLEAA